MRTSMHWLTWRAPPWKGDHHARGDCTRGSGAHSSGAVHHLQARRCPSSPCQAPCGVCAPFDVTLDWSVLPLLQWDCLHANGDRRLGGFRGGGACLCLKHWLLRSHWQRGCHCRSRRVLWYPTNQFLRAKGQSYDPVVSSKKELSSLLTL